MQREYKDGTEPDVLPHWEECHGPCQQGRLPCPCPQACERAGGLQDLSVLETLGRLAVWALAVVGLAAVALALFEVRA